MPETDVVFFGTGQGDSSALAWIEGLPSKVQDKLIVKVERLKECGHELRRPEADYLRDGIYELRVRFQSVHYRLLYFFNGKQAVISHGCTKESEVPAAEISQAIKNKQIFENDPAGHTYKEPE